MPIGFYTVAPTERIAVPDLVAVAPPEPFVSFIRAFAERCEGDRHHFRFIVSPEDAVDMADLKGHARELMAQMEKDLGTKLDWVGADHWNTDNSHTVAAPVPPSR